MTIKKRFNKAIIYICIAFFSLAVAFVFITFRGKSQAGLIEVGCSAFVFVIFLHVLKKIIPHSAGMIVTVLSLLMAIMLLFANYSLQKKKHKDYTFREFLVGDFLTKRIMGKQTEIPSELLVKKLENIIPGEFTQTRTEKYTIESPFEKPEKDLMGKPSDLPLEELSHVTIRKENLYSFQIPRETIGYKPKIAVLEGLKLGMTRLTTEFIEDDLEFSKEESPGHHLSSSLYLPLETEAVSNRLFRGIFSQSEKQAELSVAEIQTGELEGYISDEPGKQVMEKLQTP